MKQLDLTLLKGEIVLSMNRAYRGFETGLPKIDYYFLADRRTYTMIHDEARRLDLGVRFYHSWICDMPEYKDASEPEPVIPLRFVPVATKRGKKFRFSENPLSGVASCGKGTVVLPIVQVAYYLGFKEVYIIGCDLDYSNKKLHFYSSSDEISRKEEYRRGRMNVEAVLSAFSVCRHAYEIAGRKLVNATPGGNLNVLPREDYSDLFQ